MAMKKERESLASMVKDLKSMQDLSKARQESKDDSGKKHKERMDAIKKRIDEDVRNRDGGRQMPRRAEQNQSSQDTKSSNTQSSKESPAATNAQGQPKGSLAEQTERNFGSEGSRQFKTGKMTRNLGTERGRTVADRYMDQEDKKKKGGSSVVGS